jgi:hypothetical protein
VEDLAKQWLAERIDHTHRNADQVRGYVNSAIIPVLGARHVGIYRDRVAKSARGARWRTASGESGVSGVQGPFRLRGREWDGHGITGGTAERRHNRSSATGPQSSADRR